MPNRSAVSRTGMRRIYLCDDVGRDAYRRDRALVDRHWANAEPSATGDLCGSDAQARQEGSIRRELVSPP